MNFLVCSSFHFEFDEMSMKNETFFCLAMILFIYWSSVEKCVNDISFMLTSVRFLMMYNITRHSFLPKLSKYQVDEHHVETLHV